jgi:hypothetical protein
VEHARSEHDPGGGRPRWVKVSAIVVGLLIVIVVAMVILGGGNHGPGRHSPGMHRQAHQISSLDP